MDWFLEVFQVTVAGFAQVCLVCAVAALLAVESRRIWRFCKTQVAGHSRLGIVCFAVAAMVATVCAQKQHGRGATPRLENRQAQIEPEETDVVGDGFGVSCEDARDWFSEVFKRLWQAGANCCFRGVTWRGDQGLGWNYHDNVVNAFSTAESLADYAGSIRGTKVAMAHSLGNMVVSAAIQDHGMEVDKYLMCNSAVPSEAYYPPDNVEIRVPQLVDPDWESYPTNSWSHSDIIGAYFISNHEFYERIVLEGGL